MKVSTKKGLLAAAAISLALIFAFVASTAEAGCAQYKVPLGSDRDKAISYFEENEPDWTKEAVKGNLQQSQHQYSRQIDGAPVIQVVSFVFTEGALSDTFTTYRTEHRGGGEALIEFFKQAAETERSNCDSELGSFKYEGRWPGFYAIRPDGSGQYYALEGEGNAMYLHVWYGDGVRVQAEASKQGT